jgi:cytochrome c
MKKAFLLLTCAALAACSAESDSTKTMSATERVNSQPDPVAAADSATGANVAAVAHQPQVDTSVTKIGTGTTGRPAGKGAQLVAASDCASCHREAEKLVGPAYRDVAAKYPATAANVTLLAGKIIKGGKGNWGDIPMTPHPALSEADAREMVGYILSLR